MNLSKRFPSILQLMPVYAIIIAFIYPWSLIRFFWRLPSFLNYATIGEIGVTYAYLVMFNFLESVVIVLVPIAMSIILPENWFHERFVTKSILLVSLGLGYLVYVASHIVAGAPFPYDLFRWMPAICGLILALVFLLDRIAFLRQILIEISDRFVIFLYISIPVSIISLLVILIRNIL